MRTLLLLSTLFTLVHSPSAMADPPVEELARRVLDREAELLERVRQIDPKRHEQLLMLKGADRRAYVGALLRVARMLERGERTPSPELQAAIARAHAIQAAHPDGFDTLSPKETAKVRAELTAIGEEIFSLRQAERRERIAMLRKDLESLEADVARRDREKDQLIQHFVDGVLLGRPDL